MARKKVNLQWIANNSTRQATFNKRRNALMKKASELVTLCGIKVSVVVYGDDKNKLPEVYPSIPKARQLLNNFKAIPDHLENLKKKVNQEEYLRDRISRLQDQMCKNDHEKHVAETSHNLHMAMTGNCSATLAGLTTEELLQLNWLIQSKIENAKERFKQFGIDKEHFQEPLFPPPPEPPILSPSEMQTLVPAGETHPQQQDWLADLAWNEEELTSVDNNDLDISNNGGTGPSSGRGHIMEYHHIEDSGTALVMGSSP